MKIQVICSQKTRNLHPSYKFIREDINIEYVINRIKGRTWKMVWVSTGCVPKVMKYIFFKKIY